MGRLISDLAIGNYYVVVYTYVLQGHMRMYTCVYSIVYIRLKSERSGSHLSFYLIKHLQMRILKLNLHELDIKILQGLRVFFTLPTTPRRLHTALPVYLAALILHLYSLMYAQLKISRKICFFSHTHNIFHICRLYYRQQSDNISSILDHIELLKPKTYLISLQYSRYLYQRVVLNIYMLSSWPDDFNLPLSHKKQEQDWIYPASFGLDLVINPFRLKL